MKIESLGYKKAFTGDRMWHWKIENDDNQYLIIDDGHFFMDMIWSEEGKFENANFTREEKETIKVKFGLNPKNRVEIEDDEDWTTIKGHFDERFIVAEPEYVRESGKYDKDEVNYLLNHLIHELDIEWNGKTTITQEMIEEDKDGLLEGLLGYSVEVETDGDHKNDGQMVEYDFTFISPSGKVTSLVTEMCLMVGFNYWETLEFNEQKIEA